MESDGGTGSLTGDGWLKALLDKCFYDCRLNRFKPCLHKGFGVSSPIKRPVPNPVLLDFLKEN
jgi:hypothetical protein